MWPGRYRSRNGGEFPARPPQQDMDNTPAPPHPTPERLVRELVRSGLLFSDLLGAFAEAVEETGSYPGAPPAEVAIAMVARSVQMELHGRDPDELERAIDLIVTARDRLLSDLKEAAQLNGRGNGQQAAPPRLDDA